MNIQSTCSILLGGAFCLVSAAAGTGDPLEPLTAHCPGSDFLFQEATYAHLDFEASAYATAADIDGDGRDEILVGFDFDDVPRFAIFDLSGSRFGRHRLIPTEVYGPFRIEAADLDGDGDLDLIHYNITPSERSIGILFNDGDGNFEFGYELLGSSERQGQIAVAYRNGTDPAIVYTAPMEDEVHILELDDAGQPAVTTVLDGEYTNFFALDVNRDGLDDIVAGGGALDWQISLAIPGGGWTSFQATGAFGMSAARGMGAVGDVTGDGLDDLVFTAASESGVMLAVTPQRNDGSFFGQTAYYPGLSAQPEAAYEVAIGDFDGDGRMDAAASVFDLTQIWYGQPDGTLAMGTGIPALWAQFGLTAGDVDGDGRDDLVSTGPVGVAIPTTARHLLVRFGGDGGPWGSIATGVRNDEESTGALIDVDGDQRLERLSGGAEFLRLHDWDPTTMLFGLRSELALDTPARTIVPTIDTSVQGRALLVTTDGAVRSIDATGPELVLGEVIGDPLGPTGLVGEGDFDGDGDLDVVRYAGPGTSTVDVLLQEAGRYVPGPTFGLTTGIAGMVVQDFDGDLKADVVVVGYGAGDGRAALLLGDSDAGLVLGSTIEGIGGGPVVQARDWDADGRPEVVASGQFGPGPTLIAIDEQGTLSAAPITASVGAFPIGVRVVLGDFDGSGVLGAIGYRSNQNFIHVGSGSGPVTAPVLDLRLLPRAAAWAEPILAGDLDGDGRDEAVVSTDEGFATVIRSGTCIARCVGDLDGDWSVGFEDLLVMLGPIDEDLVTPAGLYDLDGDGVRAFGDLLQLLANWGACDK